MKRWVASTYDMPVDAWERVMELLERAKQVSGIRYRESGLRAGLGRRPDS